MAAFYPLARRHFYGRRRFRGSRLKIRLISLLGRSEIKKIVHRMSEILLATEITFRRLDRCMPQQELNLLQFAAAAVAQFGTSSAQVMRGNPLQSSSFAAGLDHVPHDILRDTFPPHLSCPGDGSKDPSVRHLGCYRPLIKCRFHPFWNRHGADVATLADQVHHCPVPLAHLNLIRLQADQFRSAKTTAEQHGQHGVVSFGPHTIATSMFEYF